MMQPITEQARLGQAMVNALLRCEARTEEAFGVRYLDRDLRKSTGYHIEECTCERCDRWREYKAARTAFRIAQGRDSTPEKETT